MRAFNTFLSKTLTKIWSDDIIFFEGRIGFEESPEVFFNKLNIVFEKYRKSSSNRSINITLNFVDTSFIYPSALLFIICLKETISDRLNLILKIKEGSELHEFLILIGLNKYFDIPELPEAFSKKVLTSESLPIEINDVVINYENKAIWFVDGLDSSGELQSDLRSRLVDSIAEVFKNINDHSRSDKKYCMAHDYPNSKRIRFTIYDNGIGIKRHITLKKYSKTHPYFKKLVSDSEYRKMREQNAVKAIEMASIDGVSGSKYKVNSGAGLHFLVNDFSGAFDGKVSILSGDGLVIWDKGSVLHRFELPFEIKGTLVSLTANKI